jgi:hypothetical protein
MTVLRGFACVVVVLLCALPLQPQSNVSQPKVSTLNLTFTTIDVPGAVFTGIWGINSNGDMVGNYGQNIETESHGFLYRNGTFTYFDYPGESKTAPMGINDAGLIVDYAGDLSVVGFLYDGTNFTTIKHGTDSATFALGINNANLVVGGFGTVGATRGFELRSRRSGPSRVVLVQWVPRGDLRFGDKNSRRSRRRREDGSTFTEPG